MQYRSRLLKIQLGFGKNANADKIQYIQDQ